MKNEMKGFHMKLVYELIKIDLKKINETTLKEMLSFHNKTGYVIISAWRSENDKSENKKLNDILKSDIKNSQFSYIPAWGGFVETDKNTGKKRRVKKQSFIIFNRKKVKDELFETDNELKMFGKELAKKYGQESYLFKPKGDEKKAYYIKQNGTIDMIFNSISPVAAISKPPLTDIRLLFKLMSSIVSSLRVPRV
jgi:hypothetical protein